jgi:CHRD domain
MRNAYLTTLGVLAAVLTVAALATLVLPGLAGSVTADNDGDGQQFEARLRGSEEVPPVQTNTRGSANLGFNEAETRLSFELEVEDGLRGRRLERPDRPLPRRAARQGPQRGRRLDRRRHRHEREHYENRHTLRRDAG